MGTTTSGPLNITVNAPTVTCIDPASGGTATTFYENTANTYTVECEAQSGISGRDGLPDLDRHQHRLVAGRQQPDLRHLDVEQPGLHHRHLRAPAPPSSTSSSAP